MTESHGWTNLDSRRVEETMTTPNANDPSMSDVLDAISSLRDEVAKVNDKLDSHIAETNRRFDEAAAETNRRFDEAAVETNRRFDESDRRFDGIKDDLSMIKGAHARNEMRYKAPLIAYDLDFEFVSELDRVDLIALSKTAVAAGVSESDAESFRNADMVIKALDPMKRMWYVAVEASFTVHDQDVTRAARNADYLERFADVKARAVVAGVEIIPDAKRQAGNSDVLWYEIPQRELQPT